MRIGRSAEWAARVAVVATGFCSACSPTSTGDRRGGDASAAETKGVVPTPGAAAARSVVERRYAEHFKSGQGFSAATLQARQAWFAPQLYALMLADMTPTGEIGYIDADPFTDAQDTAANFGVGVARQAHDTVFVAVEVTFGPTTGSGQERHHVTLAMLPAPNGWQIANFIYADRDMITALRGEASSAGASRP